MLPLPQGVTFCLNTLEQCGFSAYLVGGCVRDCLLGRVPNDWDLCTAALPEEIIRCFPRNKTILTGAAHGTVTVLVEGMQVEITTFRVDGDYGDHRRPRSVSFTRSLEEDLARRDFTINAMAYHPGEGVVDPYGGRMDLAGGKIRCVGDPETRFTEDALRILRMFRFCAQLEFEIEGETQEAAGKCREFLGHISGERINAELNKILMSPKAGDCLAAMCDTGVFQCIMPEFAPCIGFEQFTHYHNRTVDRHIFAAVDAAPRLLPVRLALLLHDIAKPRCFVRDSAGAGHFKGHQEMGARMAREILERLHYDRRTIELAAQLVLLHHEPIPAEEVPLKRLLSRIGAEHLQMLAEVRIADTSAKDPKQAAPRLEALRRGRSALADLIHQNPACTIGSLAVNGEDLMALGCPQGKRIGEILARLLELVITDESRNTREWLLEEARRLLDAEKKSSM